MKEHCQPECKQQFPVGITIRQCRDLVQLATVTEDQQRETRLIFFREPRHVGKSQDIGTMLVIAVVGDGYADFVQFGRPGQEAYIVFLLDGG